MQSFYNDMEAAIIAGFRLASIVVQHLERLGYDVRRNIGGHGVIGRLKNGPAKTVLLRADIDALPYARKYRASLC